MALFPGLQYLSGADPIPALFPVTGGIGGHEIHHEADEQKLLGIYYIKAKHVLVDDNVEKVSPEDVSYYFCVRCGHVLARIRGRDGLFGMSFLSMSQDKSPRFHEIPCDELIVRNIMLR